MFNRFRFPGLLLFALATAAGTGFGQEPPGPRPPGPPPPLQPNRGPMNRALHAGPPGRWWSDPNLAQRLSLTQEQQKRMDAIFDQSRLKLIDLSAELQKQEAIMEPLLGSDNPDEKRILIQIDHVAQARAELEKGNARMLLGLRSVLTPEQWKKLQAEAPERREPPRRPR